MSEEIGAAKADADHAAYLEHRKQLLDLGFGQLALYDKLVVLIASGALVLSLTFYETIDKAKRFLRRVYCLSHGSVWLLRYLSTCYPIRRVGSTRGAS